MEINLLPPCYRMKTVSTVQYFFLGAALLFFLGCILSYAYLHYRLYMINTDLEIVQSDYRLLKETRERQASIENNLAVIKGKDAFLLEMSGKSLSGYAVLVHLGVLAAEGVELREIAVNDSGYLLLKGDMSDYTHLLNFMDGFKSDVLFEPPSLVDANADLERDKDSRFTLAVKLKERRDDHGSPDE